jgi:zinc D-Ala-D-Ala carboxypeptidase
VPIFTLIQHHWRALALGGLGLSLALSLNLANNLAILRQQPSQAQAIAVAPALTAEQLNQRLLAVLPLAQRQATDQVQSPTPAQAPVPAQSQPTLGSAALASPAPSLASPAPVAVIANSPAPQPSPRVTAPVPTALAAPLNASAVASQASPELAFNPGPSASSTTQYGHFPYTEAYREQLVIAGSYGSRPEQLHVDAANAFGQMSTAARREGVALLTISGFRDRAIQAELFTAQTTRQGSPERAARISAPPGHSEHHTGYALDIGDEGSPSTDLEVSFEQTPAFRWLAQNAANYGFELSFPRGNAQGVSYEPWHWRYVGNTQAQQVFAQAR